MKSVLPLYGKFLLLLVTNILAVGWATFFYFSEHGAGAAAGNGACRHATPLAIRAIATDQAYTSTGLRVGLLEDSNPGLASRVFATDGAIGYADPTDVFLPDLYN